MKKEETPEEEAFKEFRKGILEPNRFDFVCGFTAGAEWKAKRMYSDEEIIDLLQKALTHQDDGETGSLVTAQGEIRPANFFSWFERFKKK
jgi:hypothetical protein